MCWQNKFFFIEGTIVSNSMFVPIFYFLIFIVFTIKIKQWCSCNIFIYSYKHWRICILWHDDNLIFNDDMFRINTRYKYLWKSENYFNNRRSDCFLVIKNEVLLIPKIINRWTKWALAPLGTTLIETTVLNHQTFITKSCI